jgi:hypothetical protein
MRKDSDVQGELSTGQSTKLTARKIKRAFSLALSDVSALGIATGQYKPKVLGRATH